MTRRLRCRCREVHRRPWHISRRRRNSRRRGSTAIANDVVIVVAVPAASAVAIIHHGKCDIKDDSRRSKRMDVAPMVEKKLLAAVTVDDG